MKINFISMILIGCLSALILISCESHEQKMNDAFEIIKDEKMIIKDTIYINKEMGDLQKIKYVNVDECLKFKLQIEKKIVVNENLIKKLKNTPNLNSKFFKKVTSLEKDNIDLRSKIDKYVEEVRANWKKFQLEINQNAGDINSDLQKMTSKNIK